MQYVSGDRQHRHAPTTECMLDGTARDAGHLPGLTDELAVVAAVDEEAVWMCLLKEARADLDTRYVRGDRQHRCASAMGVIQPLDQMRVPRAAAARAHRQPPGQLRLGRRGKRSGLLVADVDPLDPVSSPDGVDHRIQAVTDHAVDALYPSFQ